MDLSQIARGKPGPEPDLALLQGMGHTFQWKDGFKPCSWYNEHWTQDRVIMRAGPGKFRRERRETIEVDPNYGHIPKEPGQKKNKK